MIAIILAAGKGSRLLGLTESTPKSLLPLFGDFTILDYNIQMLRSLGIGIIKIVTGFQSLKIEKHVLNMDIEIIYNPFWNLCNVLGSLYLALPYIDDDFLFLHADTLLERKGWIKLIENPNPNVLPFKKKVCGEEEMKIRLDRNNNLLEISKSMSSEEANGEFIGIAKFSKEFVSFFSKKSKDLFQTGDLQYYMEAVISEAIKDAKRIEIIDVEDAKFIEIDFIEDYILAQQEFANFDDTRANDFSGIELI